ncbi:arsenical-resistance protein 3 [[Candida] anglica]|uniref:Arsenical-resistance protein 3 n=1 Tax=[Candida] anglica TaxID=148631 RepID=A0ABP0E7F5_9ASCO
MACRTTTSPPRGNSLALQILKDLSWTDRLLPLLIILAMIVGILLSVYAPSSRNDFDSSAKLEGVSVPLAIGLLVMMVPPLCKVEWENLHKFATQRAFLHQLWISFIINWVIGPFVMFGLAWLTLFDEDEYRTGIIMIGLARCIAMVLLWNDIADGDNTLCAIIVLINSLLQIVLYAPYQIFFCYAITGTSYGDNVGAAQTYPLVARSVAVYLGIPLGVGVIIRLAGLKLLGRDRYYKNLLPIVGPWALIGLLYTIVVIFIEKGDDFIKHIGSAFRCFVPLTLYFSIMWFGTFFGMRFISNTLYRRSNMVASEKSDETQPLCGCEDWKRGKWNQSSCSANYGETITQTFTAASNNFELSLAIAISIYGSGSKQAIAATFGPLLEVPILLALTYVAKIFKEKFAWVDVKRGVFDEEISAEDSEVSDESA